MDPNKLLITRMDGRVLTALYEGPRPVQLDIDGKGGSLLGNIYIGKVQNVVKNINAAFVDLGGGRIGYYNLRGSKKPVRPGDELVVQVSGDAVKTKVPSLTCDLNLPGRTCVLTAGRPQICFSSRIRDESWKRKTREMLLPETEPDLGLIVRTNAKDAPARQLVDEFRKLKQRYRALREAARFRTCYSLLLEADPPFICRIRDARAGSVGEIVTDQPDLFRITRDYLEREQPEDAGRLRLYGDPMVPLSKLYSLEKAVDGALQKKVWLNCGGYLVIEYTEAMTVIDVNSGRCLGRKNTDDTLFGINMEAAAETARQLRLRNLSGIIIVDFIDMEDPGKRAELMDFLSAECGKDPVKTTVVDMTKLNLAEITRKRTRRPFHEQFRCPS